MGKYTTTIYGLRVVVDYDYNPGFPGSRFSPPEEPEVDIHDWHFADEDSEQMFASQPRVEQTVILRDIAELVYGYLRLDIMEHEALLERQEWTRHRKHLEQQRKLARMA